MNSLKLLSSVAIIALSVTGCLGNKQPPRHNQVVGEKRAPVLNVQTAQPDVPFPTNEMLYATPPEPKVGLQPRTNWDETDSSAQNLGQNNVATGAMQPSPLYYYEQQQAKLQSNDLNSANVTAEVAPAAESVDALSPSPLAIQEAAEQPIAKMSEVQFEPEQVEIKEEYPKLNDVPNPQQLQEVGRFKQAKENADEFVAEQKQGEAAIPKEPEFEELTLDEFMAKEAVNEAVAEPVVKEIPKTEPIAEVVTPNIEEQTPAANIDYSKQPLPEVPINEAETIMQPSLLPQPEAAVAAPATTAVAPQIEPAKIEPFADANSKQEIKQEMEAQAPVIAPASAEPQVVAVPDAEPVAATPRNQRLYTSGGVIELTPPTSISSRGRELPASRYQYRRQSTH
jgi:hypothetical protein